MVPVFQFLSTNGDGTGDVAITGDYSVTPETFELAAATRPVCVKRLIVLIRDSGTFDAAKYGNNITLTVGLTFYVEDTATQQTFTLTPLPIVANVDWGRYCYDAAVKTWGTGDEFLLVRWTLAKSLDPGLILEAGTKLVLAVNDDFSGLVDHTVMAQGFRFGREAA